MKSSVKPAQRPPRPQEICSCDSGNTFKQCCGLHLDGDTAPKTAKKLMRSRFTAYALGGYGDYLLATWHPDHTGGLDAASLSIKSTTWQSLEIVDSSQDYNVAFVEFKAHFLDPDGQTGVHHERSRFTRVSGHWYYIDGEVRNS